MIRKTRHTLITAEIMGFFLIVIAILSLLTNRPVFRIAAMALFGLIIIVAAIFAVFATLAVKEHKAGRKKK